MKKLFFLILPFLFGATYYVASDGGGNYTTYSSANAVAISGDTVSGKRGDTFREQIVPVSGVTYNAYGTGAKPLILGSKQENAESDWVDQTDNIWLNNDATFTVDVGNLIFDNEESCGIKVKNETDLDTQDEFWYDFTNDLIKVYSIGNPASVHFNIECALKKDIIQQTDVSHVVYENLDLRYGSAHGIAGSSTNNITIRDCDLSFIGGADQKDNYTVRYGNGIEFWNEARDNLVERCRLSNIYDAGLTAQGSGTYTVSNIIFKNNLIDKCEYSYEEWHSNETSNISGIKFIHNTCTNAGGGWGHNQRWDYANSRHFCIYGNSANMLSKSEIKNNIFDTSTEYGIGISSSSYISDFDIDYNLWNVSTLARIGTINCTTLASWKSYSSQDTHSIASDPMLESSPSTVGMIATNSPCIDAGTDVGVTTDYRGVSRESQYDGDLPDIGAYERKKKQPVYTGQSYGEWNSSISHYRDSQ